MKTKAGAAISRRDATIACAISMGMGAVLASIALIGSEIPLKCFSAGALSDWIAAGGTWVIGYGAWKYAREAHRQRLTEHYSAELRRLRLNYAQIAALRDRAALIKGAVTQMASIDLKADDRGVSDAISACRVGASVLADLPPNEGIFLLSEKTLRTHNIVSLSVTQMKGLFARGTDMLEKDGRSEASAAGYARHLVAIASELNADCEELIDQLTQAAMAVSAEAKMVVKTRQMMLR